MHSSTRQEGEAHVAKSAGLQWPRSCSVPILRGQCPKTCHGRLLTADTRVTVRGRKQRPAFPHSPICSLGNLWAKPPPSTGQSRCGGQTSEGTARDHAPQPKTSYLTGQCLTGWQSPGAVRDSAQSLRANGRAAPCSPYPRAKVRGWRAVNREAGRPAGSDVETSGAAARTEANKLQIP